MSMAEERLQILRMVASGKIRPEEAERLLAALQEQAGGGTEGDQEREADRGTAAGAGGESQLETGVLRLGGKNSRRFLRIKVEEAGSTRVNVNIPLDLAKLALQFLPKDARRRLEGQLEGVDLDEILDAARMGAEGKLVEVQDEDDRVEIWID